ncbi:MAG TPA: homoserine kinase [Actinomycetales bacterium]|nr:homoserine kinase [Actinomycetales bacterium]
MKIAAGASAWVEVPATSANLGPGFDSLGLALGLTDEVQVEARGDAVVVEVEGEGADELPRDESHLVVRSLRAALDAAGCAQPAGLRLRCRNRLPHGRGLGSSASAAVAGVLAARGLLRNEDTVDRVGALDDATALRVATALEGHPDNAAAALLGGLTIAWSEGGDAVAVRVDPHPELAPVVLVPPNRLSTRTARAALPAMVPHADAAFNAARSALLVEALSRRPDLLLAATEDRLHQRQRGPAMPTTLALVDGLRSHGLAAVVSGAGPSVLVLSTATELADVTRTAAGCAPHGWRVLTPGIARRGAQQLP